MAQIPIDLPPEQHALFRALTAHADAANQKMTNRIEKVEEAQRDTQKDTSVALAKANAACRAVSDVLTRVEALEHGRNGGRHAVPSKLLLDEVIHVKIKHVRDLVNEAKNHLATVVVGYH
jgi:hypothetical protein